ncbi:hypothetical protein SESBI_29259 [Sesbania bispinosa]|nr:hypothetical protein SESBI_29259 [Sesbania bispinosa]
MKFPLPNGNVGVLKADQMAARRCYRNSLRIKRGAWEEFAKDPPERVFFERVFFVKFDPTGELRDGRRPYPTEDLTIMTYIF